MLSDERRRTTRKKKRVEFFGFFSLFELKKGRIAETSRSR